MPGRETVYCTVCGWFAEAEGSVTCPRCRYPLYLSDGRLASAVFPPERAPAPPVGYQYPGSPIRFGYHTPTRTEAGFSQRTALSYEPLGDRPGLIPRDVARAVTALAAAVTLVLFLLPFASVRLSDAFIGSQLAALQGSGALEQCIAATDRAEGYTWTGLDLVAGLDPSAAETSAPPVCANIPGAAAAPSAHSANIGVQPLADLTVIFLVGSLAVALLDVRRHHLVALTVMGLAVAMLIATTAAISTPIANQLAPGASSYVTLDALPALNLSAAVTAVAALVCAAALIPRWWEQPGSHVATA